MSDAPPLSVDAALERILGALARLPAETVALPEAPGRVLAAPVTARLTQPPFVASAMDGWAVRAGDLADVSPDRPVSLRRIGESAAGRPFAGRLETGETVRIFTGAPVPDGADTVVMQEDVAERDGAAVFVTPVAEGRFVRPAGGDFTAGAVVLEPGRRLGPRDIGLAAAADSPWLTVHRRPRVAVLATGDEIALPGCARGPAQLVSSNAPMLCALVAAFGGQPLHLGVAGDTSDALAEALAAAEGADLLLTTGGASVGAHDGVRQRLGSGETPPLVSRVALRPGGPLLFGHAGRLPWLGLPGNPASTGVAAALFLVPALQRLAGLPATGLPRRTALLTAALPATGGRAEYPRATLHDSASLRSSVTPLAEQDPALTRPWAAAGVLIVRPAGSPPAAVGDAVTVIELTGDCRQF